jgi:gliding motility-associated-like protein
LSDSTILTPVFNYPDSVLYVLIGTGANGCVSKDSVQMGVVHIILNLPSAGPICSDSSLLIAASTSATQVMWSPALGLNRTDTINPVFNYSQSVTYLVTVLEKGCSLSDSLKVDVEYCQSHLVAPNAFSPDGNGKNDHFTVFGNNIATYEIKIFNRWGEEVYYSDDVSQLNQQDQGWDGTYKGKKQDAGTFVYYITAKDVNGKNIELKGNVTLIR